MVYNTAKVTDEVIKGFGAYLAKKEKGGFSAVERKKPEGIPKTVGEFEAEVSRLILVDKQKAKEYYDKHVKRFGE